MRNQGTKLKNQYTHGLYYLILDYLKELQSTSLTIVLKDTYVLIPIQEDKHSGEEYHLRIDKYCDLEHRCLLPYHLTHTKNQTIAHAYFHLLNEYTPHPVISTVTYHASFEIDGEKQAFALPDVVKEDLYQKIVQLAIPLVHQLLIFRNQKLTQLQQIIEKMDEKLIAINPIDHEQQIAIDMIKQVLELLETQKNCYEQIYLYCNQDVSKEDSLPLVNIRKLIHFFKQQIQLKSTSSSKLATIHPIVTFESSKKSMLKKSKSSSCKSKDASDFKMQLEALLTRLEQSRYPHVCEEFNSEMMILEHSFDFKRCYSIDKTIKVIHEAANQKLKLLEQENQQNNEKKDQELTAFSERVNKVRELRIQIKNDSRNDLLLDSFLNKHMHTIFEFLKLYHEVRREWIIWRLDTQMLPKKLTEKKLEIIEQSSLNDELSSFNNFLELVINISIIEGNHELLFKLFDVFPKVRQMMNQPIKGYEGLVIIIIQDFLLRPSLSEMDLLKLDNLIKIENFCFERFEIYRRNFFVYSSQKNQFHESRQLRVEFFKTIFMCLKNQKASWGIAWFEKHACEKYQEELLEGKLAYQEINQSTKIKKLERPTGFLNAFFILMLMGAVIACLSIYQMHRKTTSFSASI